MQQMRFRPGQYSNGLAYRWIIKEDIQYQREEEGLAEKKILLGNRNRAALPFFKKGVTGFIPEGDFRFRP